MKRGEPPKRRTPLNPGQPLQRRTEMPRARTALPRARETAPKPSARPSRPRVTAEEREARRLVRARSGGRCEVCGTAQATNFQHRKAQGQGGPWSAVNGLDVCGMGNASGCHGRIHQGPAEAYARGWSVRSGWDEATRPVDHAWLGRVLLLADGTASRVEEAA